ncbi:hypothetical protein RJ641_028782, partial [Dillenia turbinata]
GGVLRGIWKEPATCFNGHRIKEEPNELNPTSQKKSVFAVQTSQYAGRFLRHWLWSQVSGQMHFRCEGRHGSHLFLDWNSQSQGRKRGKTYGAAIWQIPKLYSQLNSPQLEWIASLDARTCKTNVLWWLSGRQDKLISIDEENLLLWSLDSTRKAAQEWQGYRRSLQPVVTVTALRRN